MFNFEEGEVILIDKPLDWTSFDTVNFIRSLLNRCYGIRKLKVGHAGTLDPLATGLLILCTGKMTKQIDNYQAQVKTYTGTILLGQTTPTFDLESEPNAFFPTDGITPEQIEAARQQFIGDLKQYPPKFSAIKINGERAYKLARKNQDFEIPSRKITIYDIEILEYNYPELKIRCHVSSGTYIRTLAEDIGKALDTGAYLTALRRTKIGDFDIKNATKLVL